MQTTNANLPANLHLITTITTGDSHDTTSDSSFSYLPHPLRSPLPKRTHGIAFRTIESRSSLWRWYFLLTKYFPSCNGKSRNVYFRSDFNYEKFDFVARCIYFFLYCAIETILQKKEWCKFTWRKKIMQDVITPFHISLPFRTATMTVIHCVQSFYTSALINLSAITQSDLAPRCN